MKWQEYNQGYREEKNIIKDGEYRNTGMKEDKNLIEIDRFGM